MKVLGIVLIVLAVLGGVPTIKSMMETGFGENSAEMTRAITRMALPVVLLLSGCYLAFKK